MGDKKRLESYVTGYLIGQSIWKGIEAIIAIVIIVCMWIVPLILIDLLPVGR